MQIVEKSGIWDRFKLLRGILRNSASGVIFPVCGAILKKVLGSAILRVNEFLHPPIWQDFWYCIFLYDQTNRRVTVDAENEVLKNYE